MPIKGYTGIACNFMKPIRIALRGYKEYGMKYPKTPHWPWSPARATHHLVAPEMDNFLHVPIVITEKLDGANVGIYNGAVYPRSGEIAVQHPWLAMVKKHHAWKSVAPCWDDTMLYGEDLYGVHSITYAPMRETDTFRLFASVTISADAFDSFDTTLSIATELDIPIVPVLFRGTLDDLKTAQEIVHMLHASPSSLGGDREGVVIRVANGFATTDFHRFVAKSVRPNHVKTDQHWTQHWQTVQLLPD